MRYGPGLRILRPCNEIWGIRRIPFLFQSCSPACYDSFVNNNDPMISELIYGASAEDTRRIDIVPTVDNDDDLDSLRSQAISLP